MLLEPSNHLQTVLLSGLVECTSNSSDTNNKFMPATSNNRIESNNRTNTLGMTAKSAIFAKVAKACSREANHSRSNKKNIVDVKSSRIARICRKVRYSRDASNKKQGHQASVVGK